MASSTVENYLKHLYLEQSENSGAMVPTGRLAIVMGVVPGSATSMVKALADSGLVEYEPRSGVRLTPSGKELALHVLRRHRLVELFLVKVLDLDWSEVHREAEELEHAISDVLLSRIDEYLGHPALDPHGDPIPQADGTVATQRSEPLAQVTPGKTFRVTRIADQDPRFLRFVQEQGLKPGSRIVVESRDELADAISVRLNDRRVITLGTAAGMKILVSPW